MITFGKGDVKGWVIALFAAIHVESSFGHRRRYPLPWPGRAPGSIVTGILLNTGKFIEVLPALCQVFACVRHNNVDEVGAVGRDCREAVAKGSAKGQLRKGAHHGLDLVDDSDAVGLGRLTQVALQLELGLRSQPHFGRCVRGRFGTRVVGAHPLWLLMRCVSYPAQVTVLTLDREDLLPESVSPTLGGRRRSWASTSNAVPTLRLVAFDGPRLTFSTFPEYCAD